MSTSDQRPELKFQNGLLDSQVDVTEQWKYVCAKRREDPEKYWWESESTDYFHLINYAFMGTASSSD
jgi:hypothetical protein